MADSPSPQQPEAQTAPLEPTAKQTIIFMVILSTICALILALLASSLEEPKAQAKDLDRSKQMMIAANLLDYGGYFLMQNNEGQNIPAKYYKEGALIAGSKEDIASNDQILAVYKRRLFPLLVDAQGEVKTFEEAGVEMNAYLKENKKRGYYELDRRLIYKILPNPSEGQVDAPVEPLKTEASGWVIPINGFGLWDAIYGYLAVRPDGNSIIGITWYDQKETPGLGANIAEEDWQKLFPGKKIFQPKPDGTTDFKNGPIGITVVKGKVNEVMGDAPKSQSAVDGMAGATLTGNGVTAAYKDVLTAYRPFLYKLHEQSKAKEQKGGM